MNIVVASAMLTCAPLTRCLLVVFDSIFSLRRNDSLIRIVWSRQTLLEHMVEHHFSIAAMGGDPLMRYLLDLPFSADKAFILK